MALNPIWSRDTVLPYSLTLIVSSFEAQCLLCECKFVLRDLAQSTVVIVL